MDKVLIFTNKQDIHADLVLREVRRRGVDVVRVHTDEFPERVFGMYGNGNMNWQDAAGRAFSIDDVVSVWYRRPQRCRAHECVTDVTDRTFVEEESMHFVENMYMLLERAYWVNPYFANIRARYKLVQERVAREVGIEMPETLVTNSPNEARTFVEKHHGNVVYKCVRSGIVRQPDGSSELIFTSKLTASDIAALDNVRFAPCVFQEYVEKKLELRVTVVGGRVLSCAIHSQEQSKTATDWRHGGARYEPFLLPAEIEKKLHAVMASLGLRYGAFDLILTPDDRFVMLEVNSNGQWAFVQGFTGLPISDALADLLITRL